MNAFKPADMACSRVMSTAELVISGGISKMSSGLVLWTASDPLEDQFRGPQLLHVGARDLEPQIWVRSSLYSGESF